MAANSGEFAAIRIRSLNASQVFKKGDPKNFIPDAGIQRIAATLIGWKEEEKLSRIVQHAELKKNDYNISPSRYIHTSDAETYGLEPGDIVINRVNSLSHLGKTALIGAISDEMVFESNMTRFSVDESEVLKEYVFKFLNSPLTKKQIIGTAKRSRASTRATSNRSSFRSRRLKSRARSSQRLTPLERRLPTPLTRRLFSETSSAPSSTN